MQRKTVFLLQDTKEVNLALEKQFKLTDDFTVVGLGNDGINALTILTDKKPDFLITELVLPGYDGLAVIRKIRESNKRMKIIVLSSLMREEIISASLNAGADYFMAKPFNFNILEQRMKELVGEAPIAEKSDCVFRDVTLDEKISKIFINVGIPPHIKGYCFLRVS